MVLKTKNQTKTSKQPTEIQHLVIGIGASAGGLRVLEQIFKEIPTDTGVSFVLITHLSPKNKSYMSEIISRQTGMKVLKAATGMMLEPNKVYVSVPNKLLGITRNELDLIDPPEVTKSTYPINHFFKSLAREYGECAIGIVLSGSGNDGSQGLREIKASNGITIAQTPHTAEFREMPLNAIHTGIVDLILTPEEIVEQITYHIKKDSPDQYGWNYEQLEHLVPAFVSLVKSKTGHDFTMYKPTTLIRRIIRRMQLNQIDSGEKYYRFAQKDNNEVNDLFNDFLIPVTNFFRDPEAFKIMKTKICPELCKNKKSNDMLRFWVPGCSTGEEAYSIAIIFKEYMEQNDISCKLQIFATDIDEDSINKARLGVFDKSIEADVSPRRLKSFFTAEETNGHRYIIKKSIRDMIIFAKQSICEDPPFTNIDLLSCRNVLIYINSEFQNKLIPLFSYSLRVGGLLFLGTSESVGGFDDLFEVVDKKWKFYRRKKANRHDVIHNLRLPSVFYKHGGRDAGTEEPSFGKEDKIIFSQVVENYMLSQYTPVCVLVDNSGAILFIHGHSGMYLEPSPGEAVMNIIRMARKGLKTHLQSALKKCFKEKQKITRNNISVRSNGETTTVNVYVEPMNVKGAGNTALVVFDVVNSEYTELDQVQEYSYDAEYVKSLETELADVKEDLQYTVDELESTNEELKSSNEELQSSNEELQSMNEELETSKEELQSLNEELITVNTDLQMKIDELIKSKEDINNLLENTQIAIIFVNSNMEIRKFNTQAKNIVNLIDGDIGRGIEDITTNLGKVDLAGLIKSVTMTAKPQNRIVTCNRGKQKYVMRIAPYKTIKGTIDGAVIIFINREDTITV